MTKIILSHCFAPFQEQTHFADSCKCGYLFKKKCYMQEAGCCMFYSCFLFGGVINATGLPQGLSPDRPSSFMWPVRGQATDMSRWNLDLQLDCFFLQILDHFLVKLPRGLPPDRPPSFMWPVGGQATEMKPCQRFLYKPNELCNLSLYSCNTSQFTRDHLYEVILLLRPKNQGHESRKIPILH